MTEASSSPPEPWVKFEAHMISGFVIQIFGSAVYTLTLTAVYNLRKADKNIAPFYHIYFWIGVVDVIHSIALMWMNFVLSAVHGDKYTAINYGASVLTCFCFLVNIIGNGLMAVNRYSATYTSHYKHFSKFRTYLYLVLTLFVSAVFSIPAILRTKTFEFDDKIGDWTFQITPPYLAKAQRYIILAFMILYFVIAVIFTMMARNRITQFISKDKYHKSDSTLLLFVCAHAFLHCWMLVYEIGEVVDVDNVVWQFFHRYVYFVAFNTITVSNGFFILVTTEKVKRAVFKTIRLFGTSKVSTLSNPGNQPIFSTPVTY